MKKIGLVGGTGPESTIMYYKKLNAEIDSLTDGKNMPDIAIESVNFRRAWDYVVQDRFDLLTDYLLEKVNSLIAGGAEIISLSAVTMHAVYRELEKRSGIKLVSIPKAVSDEIVSKGIKKIGLLGTVFTMEQDYMKNDLVNAGVQVVVPNSNERELIGKRIFEELENGIVKQSTLLEFTDIINRMKKEDGIEGVILGCTELPLLLNSENCPVECFDSVDIHLKKLIQMAMEPYTELDLSLEDTEWPFEYTDNDRRIARGIVYDDEGNFYFVRAERDDAFGKAITIETAGGGVEEGEDLLKAIKRELNEELGVEVEVVQKIGVVNDYYNIIHRHNINNYFLCKVISFGDKHLTEDEIDSFHLSTLKLTYDEAVAEYEKRKETRLGRLVANRELPILKRAKEIIEN